MKRRLRHYVVRIEFRGRSGKTACGLKITTPRIDHSEVVPPGDELATSWQSVTCQNCLGARR